MDCLDDPSLFKTLFKEIAENLQIMQKYEWINIKNLDQSRICVCLGYLIDLCNVVGEYINVPEAKYVQVLAQNVFKNWQTLINSKVFDDMNDYKGDIRKVLRETYPNHFFQKTFRSGNLNQMKFKEVHAGLLDGQANHNTRGDQNNQIPLSNSISM